MGSNICKECSTSNKVEWRELLDPNIKKVFYSEYLCPYCYSKKMRRNCSSCDHCDEKVGYYSGKINVKLNFYNENVLIKQVSKEGLFCEACIKKSRNALCAANEKCLSVTNNCDLK